jgi:hypothetical protein
MSNVNAFASVHHHKWCPGAKSKKWAKDSLLTKMGSENPWSGRRNIAKTEVWSPAFSGIDPTGQLGQSHN